MDAQLDGEDRQAISQVMEVALTALAFVFVGLLVVEYALPLTPAQTRLLDLAGWIIWAIFTVDFVARLALADDKGRYLRGNWVAALAVALPAFRVFRIFRALRVIRSVRLVRLVTGTSRGARAVGQVAGFAGAGYVALLTLLVLPLAAAGVTWLERGVRDAEITSFGAALWWAATTLIQQGGDEDPVTAEGRALSLLLMVYAIAVSGYITAALAALLLGRREQSAEEPTVRRNRLPDHVPARNLVAGTPRGFERGEDAATARPLGGRH